MMIRASLKRAINFPGFGRIGRSGNHALASQQTTHPDRLQDIHKRDDSTAIHEISKTIGEKLDRVSLTLPKSHIFKVHDQLRVVNEKAYEPVLLSLGPYHHGKTDLQNMEEHKLRYLNRLMKRREEGGKGVARSNQLITYLRSLKQVEEQARGYYDEAITLEPGKFLEMMLLDGCFVIELFREFSRDERERDPLLTADWIHNALARDLTLLENQLPFPVLECLHHLTCDEPDLLHLIFTALNYLPVYSHLPPCQSDREKAIARQSISDLAKRPLLPPSTNSFRKRRLNPEKLDDIKHLLDLVRKFMLVEETLEMESHPKHGAKRVASRDGITKRRKKFTYSAVELRDSGVTFKRAERGKFYNVRFRNGILEIPVIRIMDSSEALFRNLIAYEEHAPDIGVKYISDYMAFMDGLINSPKDVELLRRRGIIENLMGDDEAVSAMLNRMNKNTVVAPYFYYEGIISDLTAHCEKKRNVWMAKLKRNYLNCPWALLSIVVGFLLLAMDIAQTTYTVMSFYRVK